LENAPSFTFTCNKSPTIIRFAQKEGFFIPRRWSLRKVVVKPGFSVQKHGLLGLSTWLQIQGHPRVSGRCWNKNV
jgi:hypothetical protein